MKEKRWLEILIAIIVILGVSIVLGFALNLPNDDALKFKEDYESLNDTIRESDGAKYNNVSISKKNPIKYVSATEAVDIIQNKEGIIYFGANWCPWCRNAVEVLFEAAATEKEKTIYYVDMDSVRNVWAVEDGKLVKTTKEGEGYYELLDALDSILGEATFTVEDNGTVYDTEEKRIYMPLIISVKNGEIVKYHNGTVKLDDGQTKYDKLTTSQHDELLKEYQELIRSIN